MVAHIAQMLNLTLRILIPRSRIELGSWINRVNMMFSLNPIFILNSAWVLFSTPRAGPVKHTREATCYLHTK